MMDSRKGYCCRITRTRLLSVPISAPEVKSQSSPLMSALIATKVGIDVLGFMNIWEVVC